MTNQEAVERLRRLGVFPRQSEENSEIFERYTDVQGIGEGIARPGWTVGTQQFIYFHLEEILKDPDYKAEFLQEARQCLADSRIKPEHVEEYFNSGADPGLVFTLRHEEYGRDVRMPFFERADQFALHKIRQWLGFD